MSELLANSGPDSVLPDWEAELVAIYTSSGHDYWTRQGEGRLQHGIRGLSEVECVAGLGLRGDRYFGHKPDHKGQVTFLDADVVDAIRVRFELPRLPASVFRRNLIVRGINLSDWVQRRFVFQGIVFEGSEECRPCQWMNRVVADGCEAFMSEAFRGGLRARIKSDGLLKTSSLLSQPNGEL